jgi:hypothetical protein
MPPQCYPASPDPLADSNTSPGGTRVREVEGSSRQLRTQPFPAVTDSTQDLPCASIPKPVIKVITARFSRRRSGISPGSAVGEVGRSHACDLSGEEVDAVAAEVAACTVAVLIVRGSARRASIWASRNGTPARSPGRYPALSPECRSHTGAARLTGEPAVLPRPCDSVY